MAAESVVEKSEGLDAPRTCQDCGDELAERTGPGRPAVYCSPECRRQSEFTQRRLKRELKRLLTGREQRHVSFAIYGEDYGGGGHYGVRYIRGLKAMEKRLADVAAQLGVVVPELDQASIDQKIARSKTWQRVQ